MMWVWWHIPVILALGRWKRGDQRSESWCAWGEPGTHKALSRKRVREGAGKMAQLEEALAAKPDGLGAIPGTRRMEGGGSCKLFFDLGVD